MRERAVLQPYVRRRKQSEFHQRCMLLAGTTLTVPSPLQSELCVWLGSSVLPSPTTGSRMQEGFFMSIEWSDHFCDTFTVGIFELLPQMNAWTVDSFSGICVIDVYIVARIM